jgi:dTDP-4-amino-4,6-dideoxygalactose transaminase
VEHTAHEHLATNVGRRARSQGPWLVPLSDILVDEEIERAVTGVVRSTWWSSGPEVAELEREFADFCGATYALAVSSGTAALHLALLATGCGPGNEVLVPSLNFVAAANMIVHSGSTPIFCDVNGPDDLTVDPQDVEVALGPRTRAIVVMHYGGHPCRMDAILSLAAARGLAVIEDAAHAPGGRWRGSACGTIGDVGCFSFFANKNLPVGEGGMVVTNDESLAERLRLLRSHGMTTLTWDRHQGHAASYDVVAQGFNYRFDEIGAAVARVQLRRLESNNAERARIVDAYHEALDGTNGVTIPFAPAEDVDPAHHLAVLLLPPKHPRDAFRALLAERGIQTSVHYPPIHGFSAYRTKPARRSLPRTEDVAERLVTLPLYPHMSAGDVDAVITAVRTAL